MSMASVFAFCFLMSFIVGVCQKMFLLGIFKSKEEFIIFILFDIPLRNLFYLLRVIQNGIPVTTGGLVILPASHPGQHGSLLHHL